VYGLADGFHVLAEVGPCDVFFSFLFYFFGLVLLDYISRFFYFCILLSRRLALRITA
jgi:hypothetical protein